MKIVNCFPYLGNNELLELRIRLLYDHVDKFIISEGDRNIDGKPKPFILDSIIKKLNLPDDKIEIVKVNLPRAVTNEERITIQRNALSNSIDETTIAFVTDEYEIIDPTYIKYYAIMAQNNLFGILRIPMAVLVDGANFKAEQLNQTPILWASGFVCLLSHIEKFNLSEIRQGYEFDQENSDFPNLFLKDNNLIEDAGWCFNNIPCSRKKYPRDRLPKIIFEHKHLNDYFLIDQINNKTGFTVVQVGTNDANDDISKYILENYNDVKLGIFVEPNALHHPLIKQRYSSYSNIFVEHKAIVTSTISEPVIPFYYQTKELPKYYSSSINIDYIIQKVIDNDNLKGGEIKSFDVNTITLDNLLDSYNLQKLDWLVLNAEGIDEQIVLEFPWSRYNIKRIEIKNYWITDSEDILKTTFLDIGYKKVQSVNNSYFAFQRIDE